MNTRQFLLLIAATVAFIAVAALALAFADDDPDRPVASDGTPVPGLPKPLLHEARLDAAKRAGVEPLAVRLTLVQHAGWDGCLGVREPGQACTEIFVGGYFALFEAGGKEYRYHFGLGRVVGPVDPAKADDGMAVDPAIRADMNQVLAGYARHEHALRAEVPAGKVTVVYVAPATFGNACLGYRPAGKECAEKGPLTPGAFVGLLARGNSALYSVAPRGVVFHDPGSGETFERPDAALVAQQDAVRADLAARLGLPVDAISVLAFRLVTWGDGCLGVHYPDRACDTAIYEGYGALLEARDRVYRYHGTGERFVATDWEEGARIDER